jgi:hypothetical protein
MLSENAEREKKARENKLRRMFIVSGLLEREVTITNAFQLEELVSTKASPFIIEIALESFAAGVKEVTLIDPENVKTRMLLLEELLVYKENCFLFLFPEKAVGKRERVSKDLNAFIDTNHIYSSYFSIVQGNTKTI